MNDMNTTEMLLNPIEEDLRTLLRQNAEAQAQFESLKRQHTAEVEHLVKENIEVLDALDRALDNIGSKLNASEDITPAQLTKWLKNFRSIRNRIEQILEAREIVPIVPQDSTFDPNWQQAVEIITREGAEANTVAEVVKKGYWNPRTGRILRKTQVTVIR